jgi:hypothetical protein
VLKGRWRIRKLSIEEGEWKGYRSRALGHHDASELSSDVDDRRARYMMIGIHVQVGKRDII